jgi:RNA polymerase sigma-70 factor (ECF subfamily)
MDLIEEKELVARARRDPEVFGRLYDQYYSQIFNYILRRVANIEIAQDITSEVFLKALKNLGQFHWRNVPFSSWLYRIATNQVTDYFRRGKHEMFSLEEISEPITPSDSSVEIEVLEAEKELRRHEDFLLLHENIAKLSIKYQEAITLRFFENKQIKEIAEVLGKREGTIKSLLHRGLEKLRELME